MSKSIEKALRLARQLSRDAFEDVGKFDRSFPDESVQRLAATSADRVPMGQVTRFGKPV
jgi:hypothetical protein